MAFQYKIFNTLWADSYRPKVQMTGFFPNNNWQQPESQKTCICQPKNTPVPACLRHTSQLAASLLRCWAVPKIPVFCAGTTQESWLVAYTNCIQSTLYKNTDVFYTFCTYPLFCHPFLYGKKYMKYPIFPLTCIQDDTIIES